MAINNPGITEASLHLQRTGRTDLFQGDDGSSISVLHSVGVGAGAGSL
jgi:hypothetical protein